MKLSIAGGYYEKFITNRNNKDIKQLISKVSLKKQ